MDPIKELFKVAQLAQTALSAIVIVDLSNSQTPSQDEARARQEASNVKNEKDKLPSQSTPARNPRIFLKSHTHQKY